MNNEQWKLEGNCDECRRKSYCQTLCTKARDKVKTKLENIFYEQVAEKTGESVSNIITNGEYKPNFKIKRKR